MSDNRIVYGARCSWWGSIKEIKTFGNVPGCPHCGSVLYECEDEAAWWDMVDVYDKDDPGYRAMIEWHRGRHFQSYAELTAAYADALARDKLLSERASAKQNACVTPDVLAWLRAFVGRAATPRAREYLNELLTTCEAAHCGLVSRETALGDLVWVKLDLFLRASTVTASDSAIVRFVTLAVDADLQHLSTHPGDLWTAEA